MDETYREERCNYLSDAAAAMDDGRYEDAIARADARLKNLPGDMDAHLVRAACLARMGHPMEASEIVEEWQVLLREQSRIYEILGDSYRRGGMTAEAIRSYERFMGLNAGTDEAERVSEKVGALRVSDVDNGEGGTSLRSEDFYTITLARLYVKQGHFLMARDVIDKVLERDPDSPDAREYAGLIDRLVEQGWDPVIDELNRWLSVLHGQ